MRKLVMLGMLAVSSLLSAQTPIQVKLAEGKVVDEKPAIKGWINADEYAEATLTIYPAQKPNGQAIIACPGGGYAGIATTHEGHDMAAWFNTQGITYAVLHYRMPYGNHEIPLSDAHQAIRYMRKHADQWNIRQLGIMGSSAGGHLASTAATHFDAETRPDFQILFYPVITMGEYTHQGSKNLLLGKNPSEELVKLYSNELQVTNRHLRHSSCIAAMIRPFLFRTASTIAWRCASIMFLSACISIRWADTVGDIMKVSLTNRNGRAKWKSG